MAIQIFPFDAVFTSESVTMPPQNLYFAYGSNLNFDDFKSRGFPDPGTWLARPTRAWLPDTELVFHYASTSRSGGALDIRAAPGRVTPGVVFEVRDDGWTHLDHKEGAPARYERVERVALTEGGEALEVTTYQVREAARAGRFVPPTSAYLAVVRGGLQRFDHDTSMLEAAAEDRPCVPLDAVFVYGTLLRGECRRAVIDAYPSARTLPARARGRLFDLGAYPGMVPAPIDRGAWVHGELVRCTSIEALLEELDGIEGFNGYGTPDSLFERRLVTVTIDGTQPQMAWTYILGATNPAGPPVPSGDWRSHRRQRDVPGYRIRKARPDEYERLRQIEEAAGALFHQVGLGAIVDGDATSVEDFALCAAEGLLWVAVDAADEAVGFAFVEMVGGQPHLDELDVDPEHGRRGIGARLVHAVVEWADAAGYDGVTLTTFRDVPWNQPFYERLDFVALGADELTPELRDLVALEERRGLPAELRVVMLRRCG